MTIVASESESSELKSEQEDIENEAQITEENWSYLEDALSIKGKLSIAKINTFYVNLQTLVTFIRNLKGIRDLYKYNDLMQVKIADELRELEFLVIEMNATLQNINRLKKQKVSIAKEFKSIKQTNEKKKREEIQEMEMVATIYDKDLLRKWHVVKKSNDILSMENFINNLAGKRQAMEYLYKLAMEKLAALRKNHNNTPTSLQALFAKPLPPPVRTPESDPESFLNSTD